MKKITRIAFLLTVSAAGIWALISLPQSDSIANFPHKKSYPINGIDVSHHQGEIRWDKVGKQNIQFAFIKASEGTSFTDRSMDRNVKGCEKENIKYGFYHYFRFCRKGKKQAEHFISTISGQNWSLPPVIDVEFDGNCMDSIGQNEIKEIKSFINYADSVLGTSCIVYTNKHFFKRHLKKEALDQPVWIAELSKKMKFKNPWKFWQYNHKGKVPGIRGHVDLNVFNGNQEQWQAFLDSI